MSNNNTWNILKGTDLISESMNKINENFRILKERDDMDDYKWRGYVESITKELENLKKSINEKNSEISNNLTNMDSKINNIPTVTNIKTQVEQAILNAEDTLANVIQSRAGQYVEEKMGDYAKTATVDNISTSFEQYKTDAEAKTASADRIVANSKFYTVFDENTEKSYLVYLDNSQSQYENVGQYYDENKGTIDPDNKGISDPDVMKELEQTFKTTSTELTSVHQEVEDGLAEVNIVAKIENPDNEDGKDIVAAIITRANNEGSEIQLDADKLNFKGKAILLEGTGQDPFKFLLYNNSEGTNPTLEINTSNFKLDGDGDVEITGKITATSGKIGEVEINNGGLRSKNVGTSADPSYNFTLDSNGNLTVKNANITGAITATTLNIDDTAFINSLTTNSAFIEALRVKHLDGADGTFEGSVSIGTSNVLKINGNGIYMGSSEGVAPGGYTPEEAYVEFYTQITDTYIRQGRGSVFYGFKQPFKVLCPAKKNSTVSEINYVLNVDTNNGSNEYTASFDDRFIITYKPSGNPTSNHITITLPYEEHFLDVGAELKIMALYQSVIIKVPTLRKWDGQAGEIVDCQPLLVGKNSFTNGLTEFTLNVGETAYIYNLDRSPESDDPTHVCWIAIVDS